MKLERMLSIIIYLTNREKVKARDLAEQFEVSVRTIYRDIEAISQAGIPVVTYQGAGGGIGIVEGYKLDKSVFTSGEMVNILSVLKWLHSISEDSRLKLLIEKLSGAAAGSDYMPAGSEIMIDLSSWNKNDWLGSRIRQIKKAIQERRAIQFSYYTNNRHSQREVEPYVIVYKQANWYLYAYCLVRNDFRLYF